MEFEIDPAKAAQNLKKHKVSFEEAASVFGDPMAYTFADPRSFYRRGSLAYVWRIPDSAASHRNLYLPQREIPDHQCPSCDQT